MLQPFARNESTLNAIADYLDVLSRTTWFRIQNSHELGMKYGEVTITDNNLLSLAEYASNNGIHIRFPFKEWVQNPDDVGLLIKPSDSKECKTGADMEFWVHWRGWQIKYALQAKRVSLDEKARDVYRYREIGKTTGPRKERQIDILMRYSATSGCIPFHLLYNGWDINSNGVPAVPFTQANQIADFGCAVIPTRSVQHLSAVHGHTISQPANPFIQESVPWSSLFRLKPATDGRGHGGKSPMPSDDEHTTNAYDALRILANSNARLAEAEQVGSPIEPIPVKDVSLKFQKYFGEPIQLSDSYDEVIHCIPKCLVLFNIETIGAYLNGSLEAVREYM